MVDFQFLGQIHFLLRFGNSHFALKMAILVHSSSHVGQRDMQDSIGISNVRVQYMILKKL